MLHSTSPDQRPFRPVHPGEEAEDWLEGLRGWVELCRRGHEPREAWGRLQRSQRTLS
ncbi:MAG: hypothetical protein RLZZ423_1527 [Cyanobacteriota bacterium]|jgi:hypothetical protein